ncbi:MAG: hypothetical protein ACJ79Q_00100 [Gemmatimonadaceae bacterium]|jgi:hypothetical protein
MRFLQTAAVCCSVLFTACATTSANGVGSSTAVAKTKTNPEFITTAEIDAATFRDAYEIVQRLRPSWFTKARASSGGSLTGTQVSGSSGGMSGVQSGGSGGTLVVYLDNTRMGGPEALRDISASAITSLQYMDAATATAKLPGIGSTVISGAIVATSRVGH